LDGRLQQLAQAAGACFLPETRVVNVLHDVDGRVCGVETRTREGRAGRLVAPLLVGADGRNSTVAKLVGAAEYLGYDAPRGCYWSYWQRSTGCDPHVLYNCFDGDQSRVVFPTDGELLLIATAPPVERAREWKIDHTTAYVADIRSNPLIASLLETDEPATEVRGVTRNRYYFRQSSGPGWALVGDAGHHKDFVIGLGISDALRDARHLAEAIVDGGPQSLERYWRQRDVDRMELFCWSADLGAADSVNGLERLVGERVSQHPRVAPRLGAVIDGRLSPYELIPTPMALRWVLAQLLRGRSAPVADLIRTAIRRTRARRQLARRRRLVSRPHRR
jgi:flavin-dependent dehydrogenase